MASRRKSLPGMLGDLASPSYPGPPSSLTAVDFLRAVRTIGQRGPIGRVSLSSELSLGEGSVRTMLNRLQEEGLITITRNGCSLTSRGNELYRTVSERIPGVAEFSPGKFAIDRFNVAVHLRGAASRVRSGIEQRDAAVRAMASGALTLKCKGGRVILPDSMKERTLEPSAPFTQELRKYFQLQDGDVIIMAGGKTRERAESGALTAALELTD